MKLSYEKTSVLQVTASGRRYSTVYVSERVPSSKALREAKGFSKSGVACIVDIGRDRMATVQVAASDYEALGDHFNCTKKRASLGKVKWFDAARGVGFIAPNDGSEAVVVVSEEIIMEGYKTLKKGQNVQYDAVPYGLGVSAFNVRVID